MEHVQYFTGLVDDDESLTAAIEDSVAINVIDFARTIAEMIGHSSIDFKQKEIRFSACMKIIREINNTIAGIDRKNVTESIPRVKDLLDRCRNAAVSDEDFMFTEMI